MLVTGQIALWAVCDRVDRARREPAFSITVEPRSEPAPDLTVELPNGSTREIAARSDRFQLIHFWATWCPPCRRELPLLFEMARRNRMRLEVWAVSTDPEWEALRQFFGGRVPAPVVRDPYGAGGQAYHVTTLPDSYLIGPDGRVRARFFGAQHWGSDEMHEILDRFIGES